jgi:hypothetical protein
MVVDRDHVDAILAKAFSTGWTSLASIATSPATAAFSFVPTKAAQVFRPMRALIGAPISVSFRSSRPKNLAIT